MPSEESQVDVARIMRQIRDETRVRQVEIERRIERTRVQLAAEHWQMDEGELRRSVEQFNATYDRHYQRALECLKTPDPRIDTLRHTAWLISEMAGDPARPLGDRDKWWHPRSWVKFALAPLRRFLLRRQYDVNARVLEVLALLINRTADMEVKRNDLLSTELQAGVDLIHTMLKILETIETSTRYYNLWPRVALAAATDFLAEMHEHSNKRFENHSLSLRDEMARLHKEDFARQEQQIDRIRADFDKACDRQAEETNRFREQLEQFCEGWGERVASVARQAAAAATPSKAPAIVGFDNLGFAEAMRGSEEDLRHQQRHYLNYLYGQGTVLDAGCGRGELLELLREVGVPSYGVDLDENMVGECREKGLDARVEDIIDHLAGLRDDSLGGLVAIQLIEHLDFARLHEFLRLVGAKIRPSGVVLLETVNPSCLTTFSGAFYADPTHQRPIHPEGARRLLEMVGFTDIRIEYASPVKETDKLSPLTPYLSTKDPVLHNLIDSLNENIRRINSVLYGFADYAIIGRKAAES